MKTYLHITDNGVEKIESKRDIETIKKLMKWNEAVELEGDIETFIADKIPAGKKFDLETLRFNEMTPDEKLSGEIISQKKYDELKLIEDTQKEEAMVQKEIRKLAITSLGSKLKIIKE